MTEHQWPLDHLEPTTDALLNDCPRFRILALGKSGAGKSSLINATFGVNLTKVSDNSAGHHDVNQEITSDHNERFILHDSEGYEPANSTKLQTLVRFIDDRKKMPALKDKLHAIWLCIEIPLSGGRLLDRGDEEILKKHSKDGISSLSQVSFTRRYELSFMQPVPVIVVFTKRDLLYDDVEREMDDISDIDEAAEEAEFENRVNSKLEGICLEPLRAIPTRIEIPYAYVSTDPKHVGSAESVKHVVSVTMDQVKQSVSVLWAIAQRVSAEANIAASISVGRKKYWRAIFSDMFFGVSLEKCLKILNKDVITVWNFYDPDALLASEQFRVRISHLVKDLADPASSQTFAARMGVIASAATIAGAVAAPVLPIVAGIAVGVVVADWAVQSYRKMPGSLRGLMGYIVDLTIVMQIIFHRMRAQHGTDAGPVRRQHINDALTTYINSQHKQRVHDGIRSYVGDSSAMSRLDPDKATEEIARLIEHHRFEPDRNHAEAVTLTGSGNTSPGADEEWLEIDRI